MTTIKEEDVKMDERETIVWVVAIILFFIVVFITASCLQVINDKKELGQAICEEEFDSNYKYYDDGHLKCEGKTSDIKQYDGLKVLVD